MEHKQPVLALVLSLFISLCFITRSFAAAEAPKEGVWATPAEAVAGTAVTINAFLYNDQKQTVTYTIEAKAADTLITQTVVTLAAGSAKTLAFSWKEPEQKVTVSVNVISALGKDKKDIPALHGAIGDVLVGEKGAAATTSSDGTDVALGAIGKVKAFAEAFRVKQSDYFTTLRDTNRAKLGLTPDGVTPPATDDDGLQVKRIDNPADYGMLILATTLASFFSHATIFYAILILFLFLLIRFFARMFI